jgi:hypothetical protein
MRGLRLGSFVGALAFVLAAAPASASVTVGQLDPGGSPEACGSDFDFLQPTVTSGNSYVMPYTGTVTSWTTRANGTTGLSMGLKIFRKVASPTTYRAVGLDGPHLLTPGGTAGNTFVSAVQVQKGDVLGVNVAPATGPACKFPAPGDQYLYRYAFPLHTLPDGQEASFTTSTSPQEDRLNVIAVLDPSNVFTLGPLTRNPKKGTAALSITTPNPGVLAIAGKGAAATVAAAGQPVGAGPVRVKIRAKGKRAATLAEAGTVKLNLAIKFTPTSGAPETQRLKVKLRRR